MIHVRLYADATQLNAMGSKKSWGVYMYIGNLPQELRLSRKKKGGAVLLGHIPEVRAAVLDRVDGLNGANRSSEDRQIRMRPLLITVPGFTMQRY